MDCKYFLAHEEHTLQSSHFAATFFHLLPSSIRVPFSLCRDEQRTSCSIRLGGISMRHRVYSLARVLFFKGGKRAFIKEALLVKKKAMPPQTY